MKEFRWPSSYESFSNVHIKQFMINFEDFHFNVSMAQLEVHVSSTKQLYFLYEYFSMQWTIL